MANPATQPLSIVADVIVNASPSAAIQPTFNHGLIIGSSPRIPAATRLIFLLQGSWQTTMATAGYLTTDPEYIAMGMYFSQAEPPQFGWVGLQNLTAIQTAIPHSGNPGTGYVVGDVITVVQSGASLGQLTVASIGTNGTVTGLNKIVGSQGMGYSIASALSSTGGTGTGLEVDITAIGETKLDALTACRAASFAWWGFYIIGSTASDHEALAAGVQSMTPPAFDFGHTWDASVLTGASGNVLSVLQAQNYGRIIIFYSTTQNGVAANNAYMAAAVMGYAMGKNTGLAGSYFSLANNPLVGVTPEPLTSTEISTISGIPTAGTTGNNGNVYIGLGYNPSNGSSSYQTMQQGVLPNGKFFDQVLFMDMLISAIQYSVINGFQSAQVGRTNADQTMILNWVAAACAQFVGIGFLAPGAYGGSVPILGLNPGDPMPNGYVVMSAKYPTPRPAGRAAMPVYAVVFEKGAAQSVVIQVNPVLG